MREPSHATGAGDEPRIECYVHGDIAVVELHSPLDSSAALIIRHRSMELLPHLSTRPARMLFIFAEREAPFDPAHYRTALSILEGHAADQLTIAVLEARAAGRDFLESAPAFKRVIAAEGFVEAIRRLNLAVLQTKASQIRTDFIKPGTILHATAFDGSGQIVKRQGEVFDAGELAALKRRNIDRITYVEIGAANEEVFLSPLPDLSGVVTPTELGLLLSN